MKIYTFLLLGLILATTLSCDKNEEETPISIDDLAGSWIAVSSVYTNNSNSENVIDLVTLGAEIRVTMLDNGGTRTWVTLDPFSDEWDSQAVITNNNTLTLTPVEAERGVNIFEFVLDNNTLELTNRDDSFDFTFTGASEVPATSVTLFERN